MKKVKKVAAKKPEVVKKPPEPARTAVHLGPRVAFFYNLGEVQAARFGAELGYRPPWWDRRLGIILSAGYYTATASASGSNGVSAVRCPTGSSSGCSSARSRRSAPDWRRFPGWNRPCVRSRPRSA